MIFFNFRFYINLIAKINFKEIKEKEGISLEQKAKLITDLIIRNKERNKLYYLINFIDHLIGISKREENELIFNIKNVFNNFINK